MKLNFKLSSIFSLVFLIFFSQMILATQTVSAAQPTVILSGVKGDVIVKKGGGLRELPAKDGMELVQGDWLRTGKTGTAKLIYINGTEATIGTSSSINIQRLSASGKNGQQSSIQLWAGSVWSKVKSLLNMDDQYEIETPTAVMGVRGTMYLVSVNPENGATQGDVIDGVVGITQNVEATQATPIQLVTMGQTLRLVSLTEPLPNQQVISPEELIKSTQSEILVQLVNDIIDRTKELAKTTNEQQLAFAQTGNLVDLKTAIGTSFKLDELTSFGKEFINSLQSSDKLEEIKQVLVESNQSLEQVQSTIDTLNTEAEQLRSEVVETANNLGVSEAEIKSIGNEAAGVPPTPDSVPTPPQEPPTPPTPPTPETPPTPAQQSDDSNDNALSSIKTVTSSDYTVGTGTITHVPYGTSKATFLSKIAKGESHQSWDTTGVNDPVASNNLIVVTAQDGTQTSYTITVSEAPDTEKPVINLTGSETVTLTQGGVFIDAGVTVTDNKDTELTVTVTYTSGEGPVLEIDTSVAGTYEVHYNVSDLAGNLAVEVTRTVIVAEVPDTTAPLITLTGETSVNVANGAAYTDAGATALDEKDGELTVVTTITNDVNAGTTFESKVAATYTYHYNVSDAAGNAATEVTRTVIVAPAVVNDTTAPVITLVGEASVNVANGAAYTDAGATALDEKDGELTVVTTITNDANAGTTFESTVVTTYTYHYNVSDAAGNLALEVTRTVVVEAVAKPQITFSIPDIELSGNTVTFSLNKLTDASGMTASKDSELTVSVDGVVGPLGNFKLTAGKTINFLTALLPENSDLWSINLIAVLNAIKGVDGPTKQKVIDIVDFHKLIEQTSQLDFTTKESIIKDLDLNNLFSVIKNTTDLSRRQIISNLTTAINLARTSQGFRRSVFIALYPALSDLTNIQLNKVLMWELQDGGKFTNMQALLDSLELSAAQVDAIFGHINYTVLFNAVMELEPTLRQRIVDKIKFSDLFEAVKSSNTEAKEKVYAGLVNVLVTIGNSSISQADFLNTIAFQVLDKASIFQILNNLDGNPNDMVVTMTLSLGDAHDEENTNLYTVIIQP